MEISKTATKASKQSVFKTLLFFFPEKSWNQLLFWVLIPPCFFLLSFGISCLRPTTLTSLLPFLAPLAIVGVVKWKWLGFGVMCTTIALLTLCYLPVSNLYWYIGILFSFLLNTLIALFAFEEGIAVYQGIEEIATIRLKSFEKINDELKNCEEQWANEVETLEDEIERLKQEAQQRSIDKVAEDKRCELLESEIELLHSTKQSIIDELTEARKKALERYQLATQAQETQNLLNQKIQELTTTISQLQTEREQENRKDSKQLEECQETISHLEANKLMLEQEMLLKQSYISEVENKLQLAQEKEHQSHEHMHTLEELLTLSEEEKFNLKTRLDQLGDQLGLDKQKHQEHLTEISQRLAAYQQQIQKLEDERALIIEEKNEVASRCAHLDEEKMQLSVKQEYYIRECEHLKAELSLRSEEHQRLLQQLDQLENQVVKVEDKESLSLLKQERAHYIQECEHLKAELSLRSEEHQRLLQQLDQLENQVVKVENEESLALLKEERAHCIELQKEKNHFEKLFLQLRLQFDEKNQVLSQTRKELFALQGCLSVLEDEKVEESRNISFEIQKLESEIAKLDSENQQLEKEISSLEELISHILCQ